MAVKVLKRGEWSESDKEKFDAAIRTCGRNWKQVTDFIGTKTYDQVFKYGTKTIKQEDISDDLKEILDNRCNNLWSNEEINKFKEGLRLYGKDWKKVQEHIGCKSISKVYNYAHRLKVNLLNNTKLED